MSRLISTLESFCSWPRAAQGRITGRIRNQTLGERRLFRQHHRTLSLRLPRFPEFDLRRVFPGLPDLLAELQPSRKAPSPVAFAPRPDHSLFKADLRAAGHGRGARPSSEMLSCSGKIHTASGANDTVASTPGRICWLLLQCSSSGFESAVATETA